MPLCLAKIPRWICWQLQTSNWPEWLTCWAMEGPFVVSRQSFLYKHFVSPRGTTSTLPLQLFLWSSRPLSPGSVYLVLCYLPTSVKVFPSLLSHKAHFPAHVRVFSSQSVSQSPYSSVLTSFIISGFLCQWDTSWLHLRYHIPLSLVVLCIFLRMFLSNVCSLTS